MIDTVKNSFKEFINTHLTKISAETLGWIAGIVLHAATIPTLLTIITGISDRTPSLDVVMLLWGGLVLLFFKSVILKDMLNIITIGMGFIIQAVLMAFILFK
jgi:hypothetical protein